MLPGAAAVTAALLSAPEVEVHQLLAIAERARRERPELWLPYLEAGVEAARSQMIEGGDVGAAVGHARRAVAAARAGADVMSVSALGCLAQALFFAGELDEARRGRLRRSSDRTRRAFPTRTSAAWGSLPLSTPSKRVRRARRRGPGRRCPSRASTSKPTRMLPHRRIWGWRWHVPPPDASTRPSARRCVVSVCDAHHSPR